ncbi:hypothetical protein [Neisseria meningitidis]|uniref:hypothetical protein n=1 Tax=Neisseria meningitidis TaxID=487 RepID=UPI0011CE6E0F|nr:hypothetical protein [Neisseria meningitidis]
MACQWFVNGLSMVCQWLVNGLSMACQWFVNGLSMVCQWIFDEVGNFGLLDVKNGLKSKVQTHKTNNKLLRQDSLKAKKVYLL